VIRTEPTSTSVRSIEARVVANTKICQRHVAITLLAPELPLANPGQFLQLRCRKPDAQIQRVLGWPAGGFPSLTQKGEWKQREAFLRRPFSIADQWCDADGRMHAAIISRNVGPGTDWLERLGPGDLLDLIGPLGHGFEIPLGKVPMVLVGGGVGIPPLLYLARRLDELGRRDVIAIFGATMRELLPLRLTGDPASDGEPLPCAELAGHARFKTTITTDDGSVGMRGVVTDALERWHARRSGSPPAGAVVFACGPEAMLQAVAKLTRKLKLACQLSIERNMGCGLGTCLSCIVRVHDESRPEGWRWALTCSEGPVFDREQLCEETLIQPGDPPGEVPRLERGNPSAPRA
jgi:dihydroorotate dehydrogenase electron transfer subunit